MSNFTPNSQPAALIFDMDGVLVDSNPFHLRKWKEMLDEHGIPYDPVALPGQIFGSRNDTALRLFLGADLSNEECRRLSEELEARFRAEFRPHARPLPGLEALIREAHEAGLPMAVASSAIGQNVEFVVDALGLKPYFQFLVTGDEVTHAKPDPEIYLKAADKLGREPRLSVAFEDSFPGIESAKRAGMKCVGIASTFEPEALRKQTGADLVVRSFEELNLEGLGALFGA